MNARLLAMLAVTCSANVSVGLGRHARAEQITVVAPIETSSAACPIIESLVASLSLSPAVRVLRVASADGEPLDALRKRHGADAAFSVRSAEGSLFLERALADGHASRRVAPPRDAEFGPFFAAFWPKSFPAVSFGDADVAANREVLLLACDHQIAKAILDSGAVVGSLVRRLATTESLPTPPRGGKMEPLLLAWARANALVRDGRESQALVATKQVIARLREGENAPLWRATPLGSTTWVGADPTGILVFVEGETLVGRRADSGHIVWRLALADIDPRGVHRDDGFWIVADREGVVAFEVATGHSRWRFSAKDVWGDVTAAASNVVVATREEVIALDRVSGRVAWRHAIRRDVTGGPVAAPNGVLVPVETQVVVLHPTHGTELGRIEFDDEISGPLVLAGDRDLWVPIGARELAHVRLGDVSDDVLTPKVTFRRRTKATMHWPPALAGRVLLTALGTTGWTSWGAAKDAPIERSGRHTLLYARSSDATIFVTDTTRKVLTWMEPMTGRMRWNARFLDPIRAVVANTQDVLVASGKSITRLDASTGKTRQMFLLTRAVSELAQGFDVSVAVLDDGTLVGIPSSQDPRPVSWLSELSTAVAAQHLKQRRIVDAERAVRDLATKPDATLDVLALWAQIQDQTNKDRAWLSWFDVLDRTFRHPNDPLYAAAFDRLSKRFQWSSDVDMTEPIGALVLDGHGQAIVQSGRTMIALDESMQVRWKRYGTSLAAAGTWVRIDDEMVSAASGQTTSTWRAPEAILTEGGNLVLREGATTTTVTFARNATSAWSTVLDAPIASLLATSTRAIGLRVRGEGGNAVVILDIIDGHQLARISDVDRVTHVAIARDRMLLLEAGLGRMYRLEGGQFLGRIALPKETFGIVRAVDRGWIVANQNSLSWLDETQKKRWTQNLKRAVHDVAPLGHDGLLALQDDGIVVQLDATNGRIVSPSMVGHATALHAAPSGVFVVRRAPVPMIHVRAARTQLP